MGMMLPVCPGVLPSPYTTSLIAIFAATGISGRLTLAVGRGHEAGGGPWQWSESPRRGHVTPHRTEPRVFIEVLRIVPMCGAAIFKNCSCLVI